MAIPHVKSALAAFALIASFALQAAEPTCTLGRLQITRIQDNEFQLPASLLKNIETAQAKQMLGGKETATTPANAYLVRTENHLCLVDTGTGPEGKLMEGLKAAGVDPSQIDLVLITHFHFDHVGGLLKADGSRAFPKAIVKASKAEADFWLGDTSKIPERARETAARCRTLLAPYQAAGTFQTFGPDEVLDKGIRAMASPGHTPGHTVFAFSSEGKELWCIGDLIHFGAIQFERPGVAVGFDIDTDKAIPARKTFFQNAAKIQAILAGAHLPKLVQLKAEGEGFKVLPLK